MKCSIMKYEDNCYYLRHYSKIKNDYWYKDVNVEMTLQPGDKIKCNQTTKRDTRILSNGAVCVHQTYEEALATIICVNDDLSLKLISDITSEIFDKRFIHYLHMIAEGAAKNYESIESLIYGWQKYGFKVSLI